MADFGSLYPEEMPAQQGQGPDPTADILRRLLFMRSGQLQAPPESPEMTRALPGYEQRDPNELAMLRHREMVRPQAGRQDFPMEHLANMATAAAMLSPVGAGPISAVLAPEFAAGRAVAAGTRMAAQYAPKATTAALAGGATMAPSMTEGAENQQATRGADPQSIRELQTKLRDAGYQVDVDGIMRPGGPTERALKQYQADEATRRADELKRQELQTQQGANTATLETAKANAATAAAETERLRLKQIEDDRLAERKRLGDERMKEMDKNLSPMSRIIRDYSGPAGMALGAAVGVGGRTAMNKLNDAFAKTRAASADALMAEEIAGPAASAKGVARTAEQDAANIKRVARVNDFWGRGGANEVPFLLTPEKAPGFTFNPKAAPLSSTYNPNVHLAVEGVGAGLPVVESLWADHMKRGAEDELAKAQAAAEHDPSEINIQRIQKATDNIALYNGLSNAGRVAGGTMVAGGLQHRFMQSNPALRPNMAPAEAEQASLQKALRDYQEKLAKAAEKASNKAAASAPRQIPAPPPGSPPLTVDAVRARNGVPHGMLNVP